MNRLFQTALLSVLFLPDICHAQSGDLPENSLLLILDVQPVFYPDAEQGHDLVDRINELIGLVPKEKIAATRAAGQVLNISLKGISKTTLPPSAGDPGLELEQVAIYTKNTANALELADLNKQIETLDARSLVICGLMAEQCVYRTAIGALDAGYEVYLVKDAVIGSSAKKKEKALRKLSKKGVTII